MSNSYCVIGDTIRSAAIAIVSVVVVDVAARVNIPHIVRVVTIGGPQAHSSGALISTYVP